APLPGRQQSRQARRNAADEGAEAEAADLQPAASVERSRAGRAWGDHRRTSSVTGGASQGGYILDTRGGALSFFLETASASGSGGQAVNFVEGVFVDLFQPRRFQRPCAHNEVSYAAFAQVLEDFSYHFSYPCAKPPVKRLHLVDALIPVNHVDVEI